VGKEKAKPMKQLTALHHLESGDCEKMDLKTSELFMRLCMAEMEALKKGKEIVNSPMLDEFLEKFSYARIFLDRLKDTEVAVSDFVVMFLMHLCRGVPGHMVMWAYSIRHAFRNHDGPVTFIELATTWPWGSTNQRRGNENTH
jgi:hypothetical protein